MERLGEALARFSRRWVPDAFVFAVLLTFLVYLLALLLTDRGPLQLVTDWYDGFWGLLEFAMQMTLILVTGYALASSPPVGRALRALAARPHSGGGAVALTAATAGILGWVHWGLGLVAGALLAREVGASARRRGVRVHFPLVAAAGYLGLMIWHSGLSGSAPLLVNTEGHFLQEQIGLVGLGETIFRPFNLIFVVVTLVASVWLLKSMHPRDPQRVEEMAGGEESAGNPGEDAPARARPGAGARAKPAGEQPPLPPAQRLSHSRGLVAVVVIAGAIYALPFLVERGIFGLDINLLNFIMLMAGLALHGTLASYAGAAAQGARAASGVIVQFPFYAGIMGIMSGSGLVQVIADWFVSFSTELTYPFWAMISAALVNFAVPSGGGQWAVQGPVVVEAARALGADIGKAVMSVALGDQLTNMIQPFWALPLLGITGLKAGQILGYTAIVMFAAIALAAAAIVLLP